MQSPVDSGLVFGILNEWNSRWWRTLRQCVVLVVSVGLMTHQAWATSAVEQGFNWLLQQEQARLQPMIDSITSSVQTHQTKPTP